MIPYFSLDHLILYTFLIVTLLVGIWAGKGIKTMKEYAIANKLFGTGVLTMTMLATYVTGSKGMGYVGYVFDDGILPLISNLFCGVVVCFLFIAWCIAPKMSSFQGSLTMAELMGTLYGPKARLCVGVLGTIYSIALVTLQIIWLGYIGKLVDMPSSWSMLLGGAFLITYASKGQVVCEL